MNLSNKKSLRFSLLILSLNKQYHGLELYGWRGLKLSRTPSGSRPPSSCFFAKVCVIRLGRLLLGSLLFHRCNHPSGVFMSADRYIPEPFIPNVLVSLLDPADVLPRFFERPPPHSLWSETGNWGDWVSRCSRELRAASCTLSRCHHPRSLSAE